MTAKLVWWVSPLTCLGIRLQALGGPSYTWDSLAVGRFTAGIHLAGLPLKDHLSIAESEKFLRRKQPSGQVGFQQGSGRDAAVGRVRSWGHSHGEKAKGPLVSDGQCRLQIWQKSDFQVLKEVCPAILRWKPTHAHPCRLIPQSKIKNPLEQVT